MKHHLRRIYWAMRDRIAPSVRSSQFAYRDVLLGYLKEQPRWLDLGCGHQFIPDWAWAPDSRQLGSLPRLVGIDGDFQSLRQHPYLKSRVLSDVHSLPFADSSFDLVTANMVMEHVHNPERVLNEVRRVLAPDGVFLFHTPNLSSPIIFAAARTPGRLKNWLVGFLEDRAEEDIYPTVYEINTRGEVGRLGSQGGFTVESCELVTSEAMTQVFGPLALFELLYIRMTQGKPFAWLRPDIIAVLRKPCLAEATAEPLQLEHKS